MKTKFISVSFSQAKKLLCFELVHLFSNTCMGFNPKHDHNLIFITKMVMGPIPLTNVKLILWRILS